MGTRERKYVNILGWPKMIYLKIINDYEGKVWAENLSFLLVNHTANTWYRSTQEVML